MAQNPASTGGFGGLGGLGGYINSPGFGNLLQAAGLSMMTSPRNNPLENMGKLYVGLQDEQAKQDQLRKEQAAVGEALRAWGVPEEQIPALQANPQAAQLVINKMKDDREKAENDAFFDNPAFKQIGGGASATQPAAGGLLSFPGVSDAQAPEIEPTALPAPTQTQLGQYGAAQLDPYSFTPGQTPPADRALEPVVDIPQTAQIAQFPIPSGVAQGKSPPGLPAAAQHGAVMRAEDGKTYQYIQLSGGPGGDGEWGWGEVNLNGQDGQAPGQPSGNRTLDYLKKHAPDVAALTEGPDGIPIRDAYSVHLEDRKIRQAADETQAKLDQLYNQRDQIGALLLRAPAKARQRTKDYYDMLETQIAQLERRQQKYAPPDSVRALQMRAEMAGLQPGTPEYQQFMASNGGGISDEVKVVGNRLVRIGPNKEITDVTPPTTATVSGGTLNLDALPVVSVGESGAPDPYAQQEFLSNLEPATANLVKGIAEYRIPIEKVTSMRGGERQELAKVVSQYDPTFDMSQYGARAAMRKSITSGNYSQSLNSANLVIQHLDALQKAATKLENTSYPSINRVVNAGKEQMGNPSITSFNTAADALASELAKVFKGAGASALEEIRTWRGNLSPNASPEQIRASGQMVVDLLKSRIDTISSQYQAAMGKPAEFTFLTPHSREVLEGLGFDPAELDPLAAAGGDGSRGAGGEGGRSRINNPAGAGQRQRAVNPQTGEAIEWDGSQWRPVQ